MKVLDNVLDPLGTERLKFLHDVVIEGRETMLEIPFPIFRQRNEEAAEESNEHRKMNPNKMFGDNPRLLCVHKSESQRSKVTRRL